jgi:chemotaxis receptor (MCP) glutamine deamidase CheD
VMAPQGQTIYRRGGGQAPDGPTAPRAIPATRPPAAPGIRQASGVPRCVTAGRHCPPTPAECPKLNAGCPRMRGACPEFGEHCLRDGSRCPKRAVSCGMVAARRPSRDIVAGEVHATGSPTEIRTILGSCVAACLYDPLAHIGGMNHFLLPYQLSDPSASARYGVQAMELLINKIMTLGGDRRRLQAKVFGGGNVLPQAGLNVGAQNCRFVRQFLQVERIPIVAERLGGESPLRVHFISDTAQAFVRVIVRSGTLLREEETYSRQAAERMVHPPADNVTLF